MKNSVTDFSAGTFAVSFDGFWGYSYYFYVNGKLK